MCWPRAHAGASNVTGILRSTPGDFEVTETLTFEPEGEGEHLYLLVEKCGVTTRAVQQMLASRCAVPVRDVSYAGMKDRHAVARQWFSVRRPRREDFHLESLQPRECERVPSKSRGSAPMTAGHSQTGARILRHDRHRRKLRRGELKRNHFRIRIRALAGDPETSLARLRAVGAPNYFGEQRFGATGENVAAALDWVRAGKPRISPFLRSLYLSSMRSFLFNEVLAERVADGTWRCLLEGEAELAGAPTGPLWGRGRPPGAGAARALEERALRAHGEITRALEFVGLRQQRRPLAATPRELSWRADNGALTLEFALDRGTYATSVLREVGEFRDAGRAPDSAGRRRDAAG